METLYYLTIKNYKNQVGEIKDLSLSYQLFGKPLHTAPIVLVVHALTGNSNVCGEHGWWNDLIGDDKCINTRDYTILAFNIPGNGYDGKSQNLISNYKAYHANDVAKLFSQGLELLNINALFAAIGGSVGGGIVWELAILKPKLIKHVIPIATDWKSTDWLIANCFIQDNILNHSSKALYDARLHAMTLYRTPESLTQKFNRTIKDEKEYNVESWLDYHGKTLSNRFQLSAYKMMNQILKSIDVTAQKQNFIDLAKAIEGSIHIVTINSDLLFKSDENWATYVNLKSVKDNVTIHEIKSIHGHDAFLIEFNQLSTFLGPIFKSKQLVNGHVH
jgi:homoserine O-acetyltransferase